MTDLVVEHEEDSAADAHVARPLNLEAVGLLGGGGSVPLKEKTRISGDILEEHSEADGSLACNFASVGVKRFFTPTVGENAPSG